MRLIAIAIAAAVVAASSGPVMAASWEEYRYEADHTIDVSAALRVGFPIDD